MVDFCCRFPLEQTGELERRYLAANVADEDYFVEKIADHAREHGYLTTEHLVKIVHWKSPRNITRCRSNDEEFVREVTRTALSTANERLKIEVLTLLGGVSWPTASVILHFCSNDPYPILDFRALWSLSRNVPNVYDFNFWLEYTHICRRLADETKVSTRKLDRALWQYSAENQ